MDDASPFRHISEMGDVRAALARWVAREQRIPIVPCDSPIEDIFLWEFRKVAEENIQVRRQQYCRTDAGAFKLDFVLSRAQDGPKIGVECDGRDFHFEARDSQRDAAIISAHFLDKIYRLRGRDIYFTFLASASRGYSPTAVRCNSSTCPSARCAAKTSGEPCRPQASPTALCALTSSCRRTQSSLTTLRRSTFRNFLPSYAGRSETPNQTMQRTAGRFDV
jgi:hypothetical protein